MSVRAPFPSFETWFARRGPRAWQTFAAGRAVRRACAGLDAVRTVLQEFDHCSTGEFSALAEGLTTLDSRLAEVAAQAAELDGVLQDRDGDRAHQSAFDLYKKSVDLAHASIGIALSQEEEMQQLESRLLQNRNQFAQNSLMFRVLVLNVRAEAARPEIDPAHRAVFASVAEEMAAMGLQMNKTVETAFDELEAIVEEAAMGRTQLETLKHELQETAQRSIHSLRNELEQLKTSLAPCATANLAITRLLTEARNQTGEMITSLQFQDIVRQQLEHVTQGFDDIAGHVRAHRPDPAYVHQASRLQSSHLGLSRESIAGAGDRLRTTGRALLGTGAELASQFTEMERVSVDVFRRSQLGTLFKDETANLVAIASRSETTNERITRLLDRIEESVRIFSTEIARHEFDVQLVALNAQVAAARVPEARALNKLTEETARLAASTAELTAHMSAQLRETMSRLQGMRDEAEKVRQTIGQEKADLSASSSSVDAKLARLNQRILQSSNESARSFRAAYESVRDLIAALSFPDRIADAFAPAEQLCSQLDDATLRFAGFEPGEIGAAQLVAHRRRYTMQAERAAHAAIVAPAAAVAVAANDSDPELFGDPVATPAAVPVAAAAPADDGVELF